MAKRVRKPDQEQRQAVALYATGLTIPEVGARLGVSTYRVRQLLRAGGVKPRRGFAALPAEKLRHITSLGGKALHALGRAHRFTPAEAAAAGRKGGEARAAGRKNKARGGAAGVPAAAAVPVAAGGG
jgi:hypothetical protein